MNYRTSFIPFLAAIALAAPAQAQTLYQDSFSHSIYNTPTYGNGRYESLPSYDVNRNSIYQDTLKDRSTGQYMDCNSLGICHYR
jgi:hypothetical protein